jgi:cysteinyl-tRNA synthetase
MRKDLLKLKADPSKRTNEELEKHFYEYCRQFDEFMNDDFNTAKVLANMFSLVNHINSLRSGALEKDSLSEDCLTYVQSQFKIYVENIFGLKEETAADMDTLDGVLELLIDIRKEARSKDMEFRNISNHLL